MGTAKRERQKQGRQARIAQAQAAAAKRKRIRTAVLFGGLIVILIGASLVMSAGNDDNADDVSTGSTTTTATTAPLPTTTTISIPPEGATLDGETPCPAADGSAERTTQFAGPPPTCIDADQSYTATVSTSLGDFTIELAADTAPVTVNNFVVLARYHFYDGIAFHRIVPGFVIQTGNGGPGTPNYVIDDEFPAADAVDAYPDGTIAMANAGPGTSDSQWFITASGGGAQLTNDYTAFGQVTVGQDIVEAINQLGDPTSGGAGTPTQDVRVLSITITET